MRTVLHLKRQPNDEGAVGILVSLIMLFVLLPAVAFGMSTYTRDGVMDEKTRSADSGALTGAAALTLTDIAALPNITDITIPPSSTQFAKQRACATARSAAAVDDKLSDSFATAPSGGLADCVADYSPDSSLGPCLDQIVNALPLVPTLTLPNITLPPLLPGFPPITVLGGTNSSGTNIYGLVRNLIPGLLHNGMQVTLNYRVRGPLDTILNQPGTTAASTTAVAKRRFKALLPNLATLTNIKLLSGPQALLVAALQALLQQLQVTVGDGVVSDPTINQLLTSVLPTLTPPTIPLVPIRVLTGTCATAVHEVISDLQDALKTNDTTDQTLIDCLEQVVLGLAPGFDLLNPLTTLPSNLTVDTNCLDQVFRAELSK